MTSSKSSGSQTLGGLEFTPFSPDLAEHLDSSNAALLMGELERSFGKTAKQNNGWRKGSIYKHIERSTGDPDSLEARLNLGRKGIQAAMESIAVTYRSRREFEAARDDPFRKQTVSGASIEMPYATVVDHVGRCTRIYRNRERVNEILVGAKDRMHSRLARDTFEVQPGPNLGVQPGETVELETYDPYDRPDTASSEAPPTRSASESYDPYDIEP